MYSNLIRLGLESTHPRGVENIDAAQADVFNKKVSNNSEWTSLILKTGDTVCQIYYNSLPDVANSSFHLEEIDIEFVKQINAESMSSNSRLKETHIPSSQRKKSA